MFPLVVLAWETFQRPVLPGGTEEKEISKVLAVKLDINLGYASQVCPWCISTLLSGRTRRDSETPVSVRDKDPTLARGRKLRVGRLLSPHPI